MSFGPVNGQIKENSNKAMSTTRWVVFAIGVLLVVAGVVLVLNTNIEEVDTTVNFTLDGFLSLLMDKFRYMMIFAGAILAALSLFGRRPKA